MPDGQWNGITMRSSIKFTYNFVNGTYKSSTVAVCWVAYPFTRPKVFANYKYGGLVEFVRRVLQNVTYLCLKILVVKE